MYNIIKKTPLEFCDRLSKKYNCSVFLKREDLQPIRSFKLRGVYNRIMKYYDKNINYVTASAGNHAQGLAYVCNILNLDCTIFIPKNTPKQKIERIRYFSNDLKCKLIVKGDDFNSSLNYSYDYCKNNCISFKNKIFVHPYDNMDVIEGNQIIGDEILKQFKPDIVMSPVGGGGLISGLILGMNNTDIYGVEPNGAASMFESLKIKRNKEIKLIDNFVDGAAVNKIGGLNFEIANNAKNLKSIFKVYNGDLCGEMIDLYQNEGIIVEPAGALSISGLKQLDESLIKNKKVVCILSGGNNDIMRYGEIIEKSLRYRRLKYYFLIKFNQYPGELRKYINSILTEGSDITRFEYIKKNNKLDGSVLLGLEMDDKYEVGKIKTNMKKNNFEYIQLMEYDLLYNYLI